MADEAAIIDFQTFASIDLRIARIVEATEHPNADKLLKLQVDLGSERRQLIAGIRGHYEPADLVGKLIVVVANLAPRTMRGEESRGMLLAASSADRSRVILIEPDADIEPGSRVS